MNYFELTETLAFGSQPGRKDMESLANKGIKTLVNLRFADEEEPELPPEEERKAAEENDMGGDEVLLKADEIGLDWAASSIGGYFEKFANQRKKK